MRNLEERKKVAKIGVAKLQNPFFEYGLAASWNFDIPEDRQVQWLRFDDEYSQIVVIIEVCRHEIDPIERKNRYNRAHLYSTTILPFCGFRGVEYVERVFLLQVITSRSIENNSSMK